MSGIQPVAVYAMRIPPGDIMVPAVPEFAAMFRLTMAAIDPVATPELEDVEDAQKSRATLKVVRIPEDMFDSDDDDSEDDEDYLDGMDDDEEESSETDEENGGPSKPRKSKKQALLEALAAEESSADDDEDDDEDMSDSFDAEAEAKADAKAIAQLKEAMKNEKGKNKAVDGMPEDEVDLDEDDEDDEDDDAEALELDEVVLCTLDPEKHYQQPLDFVVGEGEKVFFKVSGTHTVHLTGNYVIPMDDGQASLYDEEDEEEDYDLSPDEEELDALEDMEEESDALDDIADPRITEVPTDEDQPPTLIKAKGKGKNKRPAEESDEAEGEADLDDLMAKSLKKEAVPTESNINGESKKLSKAEKKKLKKLKTNEGEAAAAPVATQAKGVSEPKKENQVNGTSSEKKVQFAKNLEQGPTPSGVPPAKKSEKPSDKSDIKSNSVGIREVQGVKIDVRKVGSGSGAKNGNRIEMRYVGKLDDGKVFDSNKSGKPFSFKLGAGEVIKGWDIGMQGIQVGGERRLIIPASLAYGNKALPGIPKNSKLTFDVKCLTVK